MCLVTTTLLCWHPATAACWLPAACMPIRLGASGPDLLQQQRTCSHALCDVDCILQVGIFQVLYLKRSPDDAYAPLAPKGPYMPFRDASCGIPTFNLQPIDCIRVGTEAGPAQHSSGACMLSCQQPST